MRKFILYALIGLILLGLVLLIVCKFSSSEGSWDSKFTQSPPPSSDELKMFLVMAGPVFPKDDFVTPVVDANDMWLNQVRLLQKGDVATLGGDFVFPCPEDYTGLHCSKNMTLMNAMIDASNRGAIIIIREDENLTKVVYASVRKEEQEVFDLLKKAKNIYRFCIPPQPGAADGKGSTNQAVSEEQCQNMCSLDPYCKAVNINDGSCTTCDESQCLLYSTDPKSVNWGYSNANKGTALPTVSNFGGDPSVNWVPDMYDKTFPNAVDTSYNQPGWKCQSKTPVQENYKDIGAGYCRSEAPGAHKAWPYFKSVAKGDTTNSQWWETLFATHDKFTSFYFIGPSHEDKYALTTCSSFNPQYPDSASSELGIGIVGHIDNEFIQSVLNREFIQFSRMVQYVGNNANGQYYSSTCLNNNPQALFPMRDAITKTSFTWPIVVPKVTFCGPLFCGPDALKKSVTMIDKNVKLYLGADPYFMYGTAPQKGPDPMQTWKTYSPKNPDLDVKNWTRGVNPPARGNCSYGKGENKPCFPYGLDLVRKLVSEAEYVKIGIYNGLLEVCPTATTSICKPQVDTGPSLIGGEIEGLLKRGGNLYVMQKPLSENKPCPAETEAECKAKGCSWWKHWYEKDKTCHGATYQPSEIPPQYVPMYLWAREMGKDKQFYFKWEKSMEHPHLHWKFYMSDKAMIFSSQHPIIFFYNQLEYPNVGIDFMMEECDNIRGYFDTLYDYYWQNMATAPEWRPETPVSLPCSNGNDPCCKFKTTSSSDQKCFPYRTTTPKL